MLKTASYMLLLFFLTLLEYHNMHHHICWCKIFEIWQWKTCWQNPPLLSSDHMTFIIRTTSGAETRSVRTRAQITSVVEQYMPERILTQVRLLCLLVHIILLKKIPMWIVFGYTWYISCVPHIKIYTTFERKRYQFKDFTFYEVWWPSCCRALNLPKFIRYFKINKLTCFLKYYFICQRFHMKPHQHPISNHLILKFKDKSNKNSVFTQILHHFICL